MQEGEEGRHRRAGRMMNGKIIGRGKMRGSDGVVERWSCDITTCGGSTPLLHHSNTPVGRSPKSDE